MVRINSLTSKTERVKGTSETEKTTTMKKTGKFLPFCLFFLRKIFNKCGRNSLSKPQTIDSFPILFLPNEK